MKLKTDKIGGAPALLARNSVADKLHGLTLEERKVIENQTE